MSDTTTTGLRIVEDATCLGCACLCDDIGVVVEGERIIEARRACELGRRWYAYVQSAEPIGPMIRGEPVTLDSAVERAAEILAVARAPAILGLGQTIESHRAAVAIADRVGAAIAPLLGASAALAAHQRLGSISTTFGEIRDRADLIVFDDPGRPGLPRFVERFVDPPGRFIPDGRAGRTVIVMRDDEELWSGPQDLRFDVRSSVPIYSILRALVNGTSFDPVEFEATVGRPLRPFVDLAERLTRARYGVLIQGSAWLTSTEAEAIGALIRDLNRITRFVALRPPPYAEHGAEAVLAWQAGVSSGVDFALGHPRGLPLEVAGRIERAEADAALLVGDVFSLSRHQPIAVTPIPKIVVGPVNFDFDGQWADTSEEIPFGETRKRLFEADAFLPTGWAGIDAGGTVARFDGVMLPLRPPFPGRRPSQVEILRAIDARLAVLQSHQEATR